MVGQSRSVFSSATVRASRSRHSGGVSVCPVQATRGEILPVVSHHAEKLVIGLKNATFDFPDDDPDDVGVDQAPDLLVARLEIAVELDVLRRSLLCRRIASSRASANATPARTATMTIGGRDQPGLALFERLGAPLLIHEQEALVVHHLVDLRSYLVQAADHRQRCRPGAGLRRFDDVIDLAQLCCNGQRQMSGTMVLQWIARDQSLERLRVPSYAFVGDAVGLEICGSRVSR